MKIWNYLIISIGMVLLFKFAGIDYGATAIIDLFGVSTTGISTGTSAFWNSILGSSGILIGIVAGVIIGAFTRTSPENYIILPLITGTLGGLIQAFVGIVTYSVANYSGWVSGIIILLLAPFTAGYIFALVEFFRGTD